MIKIFGWPANIFIISEMLAKKKSLCAGDKQFHLYPNKTGKKALNGDNIIEKYLNCHNKQDRWRLFSKSYHQKHKHHRHSGSHRLTAKEETKSYSDPSK